MSKIRFIAISLVAISMGLFSALLLSVSFGLIISNRIESSSDGRRTLIGVLSFVIFGLGWFASLYVMTNGARSFRKVFARGFLIWSAEWLFVIFSIIVNALFEHVSSSEAELTDALAFFVKIVALVSTLGFSVIMATGSLIGYALTIFLPKELEPES